MCDSVLRKAGYRVGLYTSPYIVDFNERMRIGGEPISDSELAALTAEVKPAAESMADPPTEFELITAIAFLYFRRHGCDIVVLEVGMGGRLDSTNVIEAPEVSVITGIALDHTAILGGTLEKIASEKAGIIKPGVPVVTGNMPGCALNVILDEAESKGCAVTRAGLPDAGGIRAGRDYMYFTYCGTEYRMSLRALYQAGNAATVLTAVGVLRASGIKIPESKVRKGLSNVRWKARFETLSKKPLVIYDGGHNIQGVTAAVESVRFFLGKTKPDFLVGFMADKDWREMVKIISPAASSVFAVRPGNPRALDPAEITEEFRRLGNRSFSFGSVEEGVSEAVRHASRNRIPLVCLGSLYMYKDVKEALAKALHDIEKGESR